MNNIEFSSKDSFEISIKPFAYKYFIFQDQKYKINFSIFKLNSLFFSKYENQYENVDNINLFQGEEIEKYKDISDTAINNFISLCQNETCTVKSSDIFFIQYLAEKYEVIKLSEIINNLISSKHKDFMLNFVLFKLQHLCCKDKNCNISDEDASLLGINFVEYMKDDRILNFPVSVLYQILMKYSILKNDNAEKDQYQDQIIEFLFKCLEKFGKDASILFTLFDFGNCNGQVIRRLSRNYFDIFDFNLIGFKLLKYALQIDQDNRKSFIILEVTNYFEIPEKCMNKQTRVTRESQIHDQNNDILIDSKNLSIKNGNEHSLLNFSAILMIEIPNNNFDVEKDEPILLNFQNGLKRIDDYEFANNSSSGSNLFTITSAITSSSTTSETSTTTSTSGFSFDKPSSTDASTSGFNFGAPSSIIPETSTTKSTPPLLSSSSIALQAPLSFNTIEVKTDVATPIAVPSKEPAAPEPAPVKHKQEESTAQASEDPWMSWRNIGAEWMKDTEESQYSSINWGGSGWGSGGNAWGKPASTSIYDVSSSEWKNVSQGWRS